MYNLLSVGIDRPAIIFDIGSFKIVNNIIIKLLVSN